MRLLPPCLLAISRHTTRALALHYYAALLEKTYQLFTVYAPVSRLASWSGAVRSCPQAVATMYSGTCHVAITVQLVSGTHGNYPKHDQMINWWECRRRMPIS